MAEQKTINGWAAEQLATAQSKGWHQVVVGESGNKDILFRDIVLMHSELSEAVEEIRLNKAGFYRGEGGKPEGWATELIDCLLRIMGTLQREGYDVESLMTTKNEFNKLREYKHGGKIA